MSNMSNMMASNIEYTYVMIKPDGLRKKVFKDVMEIFLANGLSISNVRTFKLDEEFLNAHYHHLIGRDFFPSLVEFMMSGPVTAMTVTGVNAVSVVRNLIGETNPVKARPGTIRAIYGDKEDMSHNVIHASDSVLNASIETERFVNFTKKLYR